MFVCGSLQCQRVLHAEVRSYDLQRLPSKQRVTGGYGGDSDPGDGSRWYHYNQPCVLLSDQHLQDGERSAEPIPQINQEEKSTTMANGPLAVPGSVKVVSPAEERFRRIIAAVGPEKLAALAPDYEARFSALRSETPQENDAQLRYKFAALCARADTVATIQLFSEFAVPDEALRGRLALYLGARRPSKLMQNIERFDIQSPELNYRIASALAEKNSSAVAQFLGTLKLPHEESRRSIAKICLSQEVMLCKDYLPETQALLSDGVLLERMFRWSLLTGHFNNAVDLCREAPNGGPLRARTLALYDAYLSQWPEFKIPEEATLISILREIRRCDLVPSNNIVYAMREFKDAAAELVRDVLQSHGQRYSESFCSALEEAFPNGDGLDDQNCRAIRSLINTGCQGISETTLLAFCEAFERHPNEALALAAKWRNRSANLLTDSSPLLSTLSPEQAAAVVCGALRPSRFSVFEVELRLSLLADLSNHLAPFKCLEGGCRVAVKSKRARNASPGDEQNAAAFFVSFAQEIGRALAKAPEPSEAMTSLRRLAAGSAPMDEVTPVFSWLLSKTFSAGERDMIRRELEPDSAVAPESQTGVLACRLESVLRQLWNRLSPEHCTLLLTEVAEQSKAKQVGDTEPPTQMKKILQATGAPFELWSRLSAHVAGCLHKVRREGRNLPQPARELDAFVSKTPIAFFARDAVGLSSYDDFLSWENPDYLQIIYTDRGSGELVAVTQLHLFADPESRPSVVARCTPQERFTRNSEPESLVAALFVPVERFSVENARVPYLPPQTVKKLLTNRDELVPYFERRSGAFQVCELQFTNEQSTAEIHLLLKKL